MLDKTRREIDAMLQAALDEATACLRDWEEMHDAPERFVRAAQARENTARRRLQRFRMDITQDDKNWAITPDQYSMIRSGKARPDAFDF